MIFNVIELVWGGRIEDIKSGSRKVKNLSKVNNITKLAKSKNIENLIKFKKFAKTIANKIFGTDFLTFKASIAFI